MVDKIRRAQPGERASAANLNEMLRSVMRGFHGGWPVTITHTHGRAVINLDAGFVASAAGGGGVPFSLKDLLDLFDQIINGRKLAVWHIVSNYDALKALDIDAPALGYTTSDGIPWVLSEIDEEDIWTPLRPITVDSLTQLDAYEVNAPAKGHTLDDGNYWARVGDESHGEWLPYLLETGDWP